MDIKHPASINPQEGDHSTKNVPTKNSVTRGMQALHPIHAGLAAFMKATNVGGVLFILI